MRRGGEGRGAEKRSAESGADLRRQRVWRSLATAPAHLLLSVEHETMGPTREVTLREEIIHVLGKVFHRQPVDKRGATGTALHDSSVELASRGVNNVHIMSISCNVVFDNA